MSNDSKSLNDIAWEKIFSKYHILDQIEANERFVISATQIKEFREPRLMVKFDHSINLPKLFADNNLSILPITRGNYVISHFKAYHTFENYNSSITKLSLPSHLQSLNPCNISSEAVALNCAVASGIVAEFLNEKDIFATVSGRMGSGTFEFNITNTKTNTPCCVQVKNSQIEIDAAYEGIHELALFEAKCDLSDDFLVRQLYYPYKVWQNRVTKTVKPIFLIYSNGIYHLYEYAFQEPNNYNSLMLVAQKNYTIDDTSITIDDIQTVLSSTEFEIEPDVPFPQADNFERVINLCELLNYQDLSRNDVTEQYAFDVRQTNYYTDAARYLGLLEKKYDNAIPIYSLTKTGKKILNLDFKQRQLAYCRLILSHKPFSKTIDEYFKLGYMPSRKDIVQIMKMSHLYKVQSDFTFERRASTIKEWINWIITLINK